MDERQKMRELDRIIFEASKEEVRRYFGHQNGDEKDIPESKIAFQNVYGDLIFLAWKYVLKGDRDGGGTIFEEISGENHWKIGLIFDVEYEGEYYVLHVDHPESEARNETSLRKRDDNSGTPCVRGENILHDEVSKGCILQMIQDLAPERLEECQKLFA